MTIHRKLVGAVVVMTLAALAPAAYGNPIAIDTDRVQVRVNDNGAVQIRTTGNTPVVLNSQRASTDATWSASRRVTLPMGGRCWPRANTVQQHRSHSTQAGNTVYSESRSSTLVCP
jgi:hypothetical protein